MGKAGKKKHAKRFDPLARPDVVRMEDDDAEAGPAKQLSAHQQRHFERKRLQAEAEALKNQKRKVSKADKLIWKKESKSISKTLKANKAALQQAARHGPGLLQQAASSSSSGVSSTSAPEPPAFAGFNLPSSNQVEVNMF